MKDFIIAIIVFVVFVCVVKFVFYKKEVKMKENGSYSYAYVTKKYEYGELGKGGLYGVGTSLPMIDFSYRWDGKEYNSRHNLPRNNSSIKEGDTYLLLISNNDPSKVIVLFDYPINDSLNLSEQIRNYNESVEK